MNKGRAFRRLGPVNTSFDWSTDNSVSVEHRLERAEKSRKRGRETNRTKALLNRSPLIPFTARNLQEEDR